MMESKEKPWKRVIMPSAMMAVIGLLVGAGVGPGAGAAASIFNAETDDAHLQTNDCDLPTLAWFDTDESVITSDCTSPEASVEDVSMAKAVCEGVVELYVESETELKRKSLLWGLWEDVESYNHETFYAAYQLACEAAFSAKISGQGSVLRYVTFERGHTIENQGGPLEASDVQTSQGTLDGQSVVVKQDDARRCSYSGLPGNDGCSFVYVAEPVTIVEEEVHGVKSTPTTRKICIVPDAMTAYNRPDYLPADPVGLSTSGTGGGNEICEHVPIVWAGGPVLIAALESAMDAIKRGEADDDDEALVEFAVELGIAA